MKIKYFLITILTVLILISISQVFSIPPYADDVFDIYKSGYFKELDRGFKIITDSFIDLKSMKRPAYGWIFLSDMGKKHNIKIEVYDNKGNLVRAPGKKEQGKNRKIGEILGSSRHDVRSEINGNRYISFIHVVMEKRCIFCHRGLEEGELAGILRFEREYNPYIYYTSERIIIFILISSFLSTILYYVIRWNPDRKIKEMFDNS